MNKKILYLILLTALFLPAVALGAALTIVGIVANVAGVITTVGTWIVVICWIITGILFLSAQGDPSGLTKAKMALFTSIGGTIVIVLANSAITLIKNSFGI